jgi:plasmid maintenance system antidote protein VapI
MAKVAWAQRAVKLRTGREVPDVLREMYVDRRFTQQEIADALGVHRVTVNEWLRLYDISRADREPADISA